MIIGDVTIDGMQIGLVEINLSSEVQDLPGWYGPSSSEDDRGLRLGHQHGFYPGQKEPSLRLGHKHGFHAKPKQTEEGAKPKQSEGGYDGQRSGRGGSGGVTAPAGTPIQGGMSTVTTPDGKSFRVDPEYKENFQGFINDYYKAGGKFGPDTGTLGSRPSNASGHPIGAAIDVNQIGRGIRSKKGTTLSPDVEDKIAKDWGMVSGNQWRSNDQGHFGIQSHEAARNALVRQGVTPSTPNRRDGTITNKTTPGVPVRGSYFDDHSTASGLSAATTPGIALPSREGLGKMHEVTGPSGQKVMLRQIDVGPAQWTGRGIDISAPALEQMGYTKKNFPTDAPFSYRRADQPAPEPAKAPEDL